MQLISEHGVQLRRSGKALKGLCPFHNEKTPSFTVDPERRTYKCFGCGEFGDIFTFLEKKDGLTPSEALHTLAERAGIELQHRAPQEREHEKRLLEAHDVAHFYFRQALRGTEAGKRAAAYLADRGIAPETVERFGLGYAPDLRDGLLGYLRKKGFTDQEVIASGLIIDHERGLFDRFRERLIVPIRDGSSRVVAFGGRAMREDQPGAKYVNSPATALFDKSATLYALDVAKGAMRRKSEAVIVEGYFDAIACHQAGIDNAVASQGTALTEQQYRVLDRLGIARAIVAFDPDVAGATSAERRGRELVRVVRRMRTGAVSTGIGTQVYVAELPVEGGDPDTLARKDPARLRAILAEAVPVLEFVIQRAATRYDLTGADGRRRFLAEALPLLGDEPDAITRELYLGLLERLTGVAQDQLRDEAARAKAPPVPRRTEAAPRAGTARPEVPPAPAPMKQGQPTERYLMAQLLQFPEEAARIELAPGDLADPDHRAIFEYLRSGGRPSAPFPVQLAAAVAALSAEAPVTGGATDPGRAIELAALRLREQGLQRRLDDARAKYARAAGGDVGGLAQEVEALAAELQKVMQARERSTVLRHSDLEG